MCSSWLIWVRCGITSQTSIFTVLFLYLFNTVKNRVGCLELTAQLSRLLEKQLRRKCILHLSATVCGSPWQSCSLQSLYPRIWYLNSHCETGLWDLELTEYSIGYKCWDWKTSLMCLWQHCWGDTEHYCSAWVFQSMEDTILRRITTNS